MNNLKAWFQAATVRAVKTAAQAALAVIGSGAILSDVNWAVAASTVVLATLASYLTSIAGLPEVDKGASVAQIEASANAHTATGSPNTVAPDNVPENAPVATGVSGGLSPVDAPAVEGADNPSTKEVK